MNSLVIPVFRNEESLPDLLAALSDLNRRLEGSLEVVFVVDGSPDRSYGLLAERLPGSGLHAKLLLLSRNFGSFAAIRAGLAAGSGENFAVMAADLQEPPELVERFFSILATGEADVVIGSRESRADSWATRVAARVFWRLYRKLVVREVPEGGVDVFGCNHEFRNHLLQLRESHSSLVALVFWLGFRRQSVAYTRQTRRHGRSAWTLWKKVDYLLDSVFAFTDLPIRLLMGTGVLGIAVSFFLGLLILTMRVLGNIPVPGYAATALLITFFGGLNVFGIGLVGSYAWRTYENSKARPLAVVMREKSYVPPEPPVAGGPHS
jgi:glycosyltransferase involved in cell wall biosynthesis